MLVGTVEEVGPRRRRSGSAGRPRRHPRLPHPDPARHRGRARPLGRRSASRCPPTATPSSSAARSPPSSPTTCPASSASRSWTSAAPRPDHADRRSGPDETPRSSPSSGRRQVRVASLAAARDAGAPRTIGVVPYEQEATCCADAARRRGRHRRRPRPDRAARRRHRPAARPTSPSSASTSPAARAAPSWPPPRRDRHLLLHGHLVHRRRARRRGSRRRRADARRQRLRPPATRRTLWTCCAPTPASADSSSGGCDGDHQPSVSTRPTYAARAPSRARWAADRRARPAAHDRLGRARHPAAWPDSRAPTPRARRGSTGCSTWCAPTSASSTASRCRLARPAAAARPRTCDPGPEGQPGRATFRLPEGKRRHRRRRARQAGRRCRHQAIDPTAASASG